jgi:hypothetical protein
MIWESSRQVSETNGHLPIVFLQLHSTEISRTIRIISRWVWETNTSSTFASLQLPFTQTLRAIEANTLKVWVGNLWSSVDWLSFVFPHLIARLYQDCLRCFWASTWQQKKLGQWLSFVCLTSWRLFSVDYFWYFIFGLRKVEARLIDYRLPAWSSFESPEILPGLSAGSPEPA